MLGQHRKKIVAAAVALVAITGGAGAIAATGTLSPKAESQAVVNDAAKRLGVEPSKLNAALEAALGSRVDAAVAAGRLTKEQGQELKARIASGEYPLIGLGRGGPGHGHFGHHGDLEAAATYLGLSDEELRTALSGGRTLAQVATAEKKSVDGLVAALVAAETKQLEQAVTDGRLTAEQKRSMVATLQERVTGLVNGTLRFDRGRHGGFGDGPPPPTAPSSFSGFDSGASSA